jgi:hypothetical protein
VQVAVLAFSGVGVPADGLAFYSEHAAQSLRAPGLQVITARELNTLLGLERQRTLLGCDASSGACVAELAAALGAAAVAVGEVGHFEGAYQVNVKVLSGTDAHVVLNRSARVTSELAVLDALTVIGHELAAALLAERHLPVPEALTRRPSGSRPWGWLPLGFGLAAGATGGVLFALASADRAALTGTGSKLTSSQSDALREGGKAKQTVSLALFVTAGASLLLAAGFFLFGSEPLVLSFAPGPDGLSFALSGRWP